MQINVLLFATLKDQAGQNRLTVEVPGETSTVYAIRDAVVRQNPALAIHLPTAICAINREFASAGDTVNDGDEVAFFPPVSGGNR